MPDPAFAATGTNVVAWIGAITGVFTLLWNIIKSSRIGPNIDVRIKCRENYPHEKGPDKRGGYDISVTVNNTGNQGTTITNIKVCVFRSRWKHIRKDPVEEVSFIVLPYNTNNHDKDIPYMLTPGGTWAGEFSEPWELTQKLSKSFCYVQVQCVHGNYDCIIKVPHVRMSTLPVEQRD